MTDQAEQAPTYGVYRQQDGSQIVRDVDVDMAKSECARLNAEAGIEEGLAYKQTGTQPDGTPIVQPVGPRWRGMYLGERVRYEVRSSEGLVIA